MPRPSSSPSARFEALAFSIGEVIGKALVPALAAALRARTASAPAPAPTTRRATPKPAPRVRKVRAQHPPGRRAGARVAVSAQPVAPVRPYVRRAKDAQASTVRPRRRISADAFPVGSVVEFRQGLYQARASVISIDEQAGLLVLFDMKRKVPVRIVPSRVKLVEEAKPAGQEPVANPVELLAQAAEAAEPSESLLPPEPAPEPVAAQAEAPPSAEPSAEEAPSDAPSTAPAV